MENVLFIYSMLYDEEYTVILIDKKPIQLFANARKSFLSKDDRIEFRKIVFETAMPIFYFYRIIKWLVLY